MHEGVSRRFAGLGLMVVGCLGLAACGASPSATGDANVPGMDSPMIGPPTVEPPPGLSPTDYGYGQDAFMDCLDDANVRYRYSDDGQVQSLELVWPQEQELLDASIWCERITTEPEPEGSTERSNIIAQGIVDCLRDRGYHVRTNTGDEWIGSDGEAALTWSIPDAEQNTPEYDADQMECTKQAEAATPAPPT